MASKRLAALHRTRGSTQARGCGREGRGALPLPRAAAVSTGVRVRGGRTDVGDVGEQRALLGSERVLLRVRDRARGRGKGKGEGSG